MSDLQKMQALFSNGVRSVKVSELTEVIGEFQEELGLLISELPESATLAQHQQIKAAKYQVNVLEKRLNKIEQKIERRQRVVEKDKRSVANSENKLIMDLVKQIAKAPREKVEGSGREKKTVKVMKQLSHEEDAKKGIELTPDQLIQRQHELYEMGESTKDETDMLIATFEYMKLTGLDFGAAMHQMSDKFMTPEKPELVEDLLADDTPAINPDGSRMTLWEALSYNEKFAKNWQGCMTYEQHLEDVEHKKQTQWMIDNWELHLEQEKQKKLDLDNKKQEWERTQAINRRADQLIADAKAKEQLKCLTQKKSAVPIVEESSESIA